MSTRKSSFLWPGKIIDQYFLEEKNPYSKRRPIKTKRVVWMVASLSIVFVLGVIGLGGPSGGGNGQEGASPGFNTQSNSAVSPQNNGLALGQLSQGQGRGGTFSGISLGTGGMAGGRSIQTHSANQVIRRGAGGNDPGAALPLGSTIPVRLINAILSTDSLTPVIAELTDDVYVHGTLSIPATTRAIGTAQYDEPSRRIQLRFQTLVYPEGDQHGLVAIAMMPDGSAGLVGDYHSGEARRQVGRFLGHFISGMADGMKDRQGGGQFGMAYEPGSIKNGILGGVALSAQDQAKSSTEELGQIKPTMTLPAGQPFVLFLEREYLP